ncbi:MAG TPA: helix-turn-helix domain-containing protein [Geothrix sp.]|nr:helix-turn-helix domain-containing protein [Geothrix sp.]
MGGLIDFEDRASDSPVVDRVWRSRSERAGSFHSMATCNWVMVVTRYRGQVSMTIRGPETRATLADCPAGAEWLGIHFKLGSFMPLIPPGDIRDRNDFNAPGTRQSFELAGSTWDYPDFDHAEIFVGRLVKEGLIVTDPHVVAALEGRPAQGTPRTDQRHVLRATGMTLATIRQIERAREATALLREGGSIADVAYELGYYDQPHLTRSLKRLVGQTPAQIARRDDQLSLIYDAK